MEFTYPELRRLLAPRFRVKGVYGQEFVPAWTTLRKHSWPYVLAGHPAFPIAMLPRSGRYFRAYSSNSLGELARPEDTHTVAPLRGRFLVSHEPVVMVLVCERYCGGISLQAVSPGVSFELDRT